MHYLGAFFLWIYILLLLVRSYLNQNCASLSGRPTWKPTLLFSTIIHIYSVLFKPCIQRWWPRKRRKALYVIIEMYFELTNNKAFSRHWQRWRGCANDSEWCLKLQQRYEALGISSSQSYYVSIQRGPSIPSCAWNSSDGPGFHIATSKSRKLWSSWMIMHLRHIHLLPSLIVGPSVHSCEPNRRFRPVFSGAYACEYAH